MYVFSVVLLVIKFVTQSFTENTQSITEKKVSTDK